MKKTVKIKIEEKEYTVSIGLTVSDYERILNYDDKEELLDVLTVIIEDHIQESNKPPKEFIKKNNIIKQFIEETIDSSESLKEIYNKNSFEEKLEKRFIKTVKDNANSLPQKMKRPILEVPSFTVKYSAIYDKRRIQDAINKSVEDLHSKMMKMVNSGTFVKIINDSIHNIIDNPMFISNMIASLKKALESIPLDKLAKAFVEERCQIYQKWGDYGWAIMLGVSENVIAELPNSKKEADKIMLKYCNKSVMQSVFEETMAFSGVKKSDYQEAIFSYEHKKYKSCALLLFSLIDSKLIRMQKKGDIEAGDRWREIGDRAAKIVVGNEIKRIKSDKNYLMLFRAENILSCLKVFFKSGGDFRKQPEVLNRNFLSHGMFLGKVSKKDCTQLFVFYYNFIIFLNEIKK